MNKDVRQYLKVGINIVWALAVFLLVIFVLPKILIFFMPFVIGWIVSLIANHPVKFFEEKLKIKRKAMSAVIIILVLAAVIGVLYFVIAALIAQAMDFIENLPDMWAGLEADFNGSGDKWEGIYSRLPSNVKDALVNISANLGGAVGGVVEKISGPTINAIGNFAMSLPSILISTIMCILSAYFFVADRAYLHSFCRKYVPLSIQSKWKMIGGSMRRAVGGYFIAQFKIEFWIYILLIIGFAILKVDYIPLVALGIAFLDLLPFLGTGTVMVPWAIIQALSGKYVMALGLLIVWGVTQVVRQLIQPKIMGDTVGMPPIPTLFMLLIGYKLGGVIGMIIALPIGIILITMNEEGVFDTTKNSFRLLIRKLNDFRKLNSEDIEDIRADETEDLKKELQKEAKVEAEIQDESDRI